MPKQRAKKTQLPVFQADRWRRAIERSLAEILTLMRREWGDAPDIRVTVEPCLAVWADFGLKGFAHRGGRTFVRQARAEALAPAVLARRIAGELALHRNTCGRCGTGTPTLYERLRAHQDRVSEDNYLRKRVPYLYADGKYRPARAAERVLFDAPPDAVERHLFPRAAARLQKLLNAQAAEVERQRQEEAAALHYAI
jgi:hypothetical protein